jgi:hypothetical protein
MRIQLRPNWRILLVRIVVQMVLSVGSLVCLIPFLIDYISAFGIFIIGFCISIAWCRAVEWAWPYNNER